MILTTIKSNVEHCTREKIAPRKYSVANVRLKIGWPYWTGAVIRLRSGWANFDRQCQADIENLTPRNALTRNSIGKSCTTSQFRADESYRIQLAIFVVRSPRWISKLGSLKPRWKKSRFYSRTIGGFPAKGNRAFLVDGKRKLLIIHSGSSILLRRTSRRTDSPITNDVGSWKKMGRSERTKNKQGSNLSQS